MNKVLISIFLLISTASVFASSDLIIYSKTHSTWNAFMIKEIEQIFSNFTGETNFFSVRLPDEKVSYSNFEIKEFLTEETVSFIKKIEEISRLGVLKAQPEFSLEGFGYDIDNLNPIIDLEKIQSGILFKTNAEINGLDVYADSFNINFVVPEYETNNDIVAFQVKIINPVISFNPGVTLPVKTDVNLIKNENGSISIKLDNLDSAALANSLKESVNGFDFNFQDLEISTVEFITWGRTVSIDKEKIKETVNNHKDALKKIIIDQVSTIVAKDGLLSLLRKYDNKTFDSEFWFNTSEESSYPFNLEIKDFKAHDQGIVRVDIDGYFCSQESYVLHKRQCKNKVQTDWFTKERTSEEKANSIMQIEKIIDQPEKNIVISIGEDYLTKIIHATIQNGEWDEILKEKNLRWAKNKAFIRFNKKGNRAQVYLDVKYNVGKLKGLLLSKQNIRFPVILDIKTSVEYRKVDLLETKNETYRNEALPHIVMKIMDVQMDEQTFWKGVPELGLETSISLKEITYGFRGLVISKIQDELFEFDEESHSYLKVWEGVELPPLIFPKIRDLHLEKLKCENDGNGRMNLSLNNDDL